MSELVSVIINVFNEADTIEREVREIHLKIISQIPSSEIIIAEDGSSYGTHEMIERLAIEVAQLI